MQTSHKTMLFFFKGLWQGNLNGRHKDKGLVSDSLGTKQPLHEVLHLKYKRMCRKRIAKITFSMLKHRWHHCHSVEVTELETLRTRFPRLDSNIDTYACIWDRRHIFLPPGAHVVWCGAMRDIILKMRRLPTLPRCKDYFNWICYLQPIELEWKDLVTGNLLIQAPKQSLEKKKKATQAK